MQQFFECDHAYDVIADDKSGQEFLATEIGAVYRADACVCREVTNLAACPDGR